MARKTDYIIECPNCKTKLKKGQCKKCGYVRPLRQKHRFHPEVY